MEDQTTSTPLTQLSVGELTERLATSDPIPGGGSAAALAGAMGAALVSMVAELTVNRPDAAAHVTELTALRDAATRARADLLRLAEEDAAAYDAVVKARRLPRDSDAERAARGAAVRAAMLVAAEVPLRTAQAAAEVLELAERIAPIGNPNTASDAGVAAQLASAAVRGALLNVRINLPYLPADAPLSVAAPAEMARLEALAVTAEAAALDIVQRRMEPS
jgi:formiminotetrahydrofolate cyclodeaminase